MLVVTVDLVPGGFVPLRRTIATMRIANVSDLADLSDYRIVTVEGANGISGAPPLSTECVVLGHDRRQRVWVLIQKACAGVAAADAAVP
jgi:hypothetical protein